MGIKKSFLTSITAIFMVIPSFADIAPNADSATCNSTTLTTASGSASLTAQWAPNTINIMWDDNGATTPMGNNGASSCSYTSSFNVPTSPQRTGYTFGGWTLMSNCASGTISTHGAQKYIYTRSQDNTDCRIYQKQVSGSYDYETIDCDNGAFDDVNTGWWVAKNDYGITKGIAKCSETIGTYKQTGTPSNTSGTYCWCRVFSYTPKNGSACLAANPEWTARVNTPNESTCMKLCASNCASGIIGDSAFYQTLFGTN